MKMRAMFLGATILLTGCSSSHERSVATAVATPQSVASEAGLVTPQSGASEAAKAASATPRVAASKAALVAPLSGASEAAKAASVAPRIVASRAALVTPQSGASEAAKAAGAESRSVIIPKPRDVPASGVMSEARALPIGVPYASDTDPVRIVSVELSSNIVHPGDSVIGDVVTSSNAASVTARVSAFSVAVPKIAPGKFHLEMKLPSVPLPPGDTKLTITALRTDGKSTTREIAITVVL